MRKLIYNFNNNQIDGGKDLVFLLGNKGANLSEMKKIGINVPCGFILTTEVCKLYYQKKIDKSEIANAIRDSIKEIERIHGLNFRSGKNKLLLSVRSGSNVSMPGMMDTILNLGINDAIVAEMLQNHDPHFIYDTYRRFVQSFASVVLDIKSHNFEEILDKYKNKFNIKRDCDFSAEQNQQIISEMKELISSYEQSIPDDVNEQLLQAFLAVFDSFESERSKTYRKINGIPDDIFTAATVQMMVYGNLNENSGTGVCFTRNPSTGEKEFYGEFLNNAQGEDIVSGARTPNTITKKAREKRDLQTYSLEESMPVVYEELTQVMQKLESYYQDMQDIEFTVQNEKLFILQTRSGKRTAGAAIKIALDLLDEKLISEEKMLERISPKHLEQAMHPVLNDNDSYEILAQGLPASPGCVSGLIAFSTDEVEQNLHNGKNSILMRIETSPEDIKGMNLARGILTARGGMTSHAAVVARGMGKTCVCGAKSLNIDYLKKTLKIGGKIFNSSDIITIDGASGKIIAGEAKTELSCPSDCFMKLLGISKKHANLKFFANAESINDIENALTMGAEGVGLCRTEHMFFEHEKIIEMRKMIVSDNIKERNETLNALFEMQKNDFMEIFKILNGKSITIRLLDPPLHEFLPHDHETKALLAKYCNLSLEELEKKIEQMREVNPMLGLRGCRLGIVHPDIYKMQIKAIFETAQTIQNKGLKANPKIMIPLIINENELIFMRHLFDQIKKEYQSIDCQFGIMIETPSSALLADKLAKYVDFMSFGSNDLTQTTLALSRDDSDAIMNSYVQKEIFSCDPFATLNREAVGELMKIAIKKAKSVNPNIEIGICGEHGGDVNSIDFFEDLSYASCSPFRIPVALFQSAKLNLKKTVKHNC